MKRLFFALVVACSIAVSEPSAAGEPDFSGEWKMNPAKSAYGPVPMPTSFVRRILQQGDDISIAEDQTGGGIDLVPIRRYIIDGEAVTFQINGADVVGEVRREGVDLRVTSKVSMAGLEFQDRMSISTDGKELTSRVRIVSDQGVVDMTIVFDRQR